MTRPNESVTNPVGRLERYKHSHLSERPDSPPQQDAFFLPDLTPVPFVDESAARRSAEELFAKETRRQSSDLDRRADALYRTQRYAEAEATWVMAAELYRADGNVPGEAEVWRNIGRARYRQKNLPGAREALERAQEQFRRIPDTRNVAWTRIDLGRLAYRSGNYAEARMILGDALAYFRQIDEGVAIADTLNSLGKAAFRLGDLKSAKRFLLEAVTMYDTECDSSGLCIAHENLARVAFRQGDLISARIAQQQHAELCRKLGERKDAAWSLHDLARLELYLHLRDLAVEHLDEAESHFRHMGEQEGLDACEQLRRDLERASEIPG